MNSDSVTAPPAATTSHAATTDVDLLIVGAGPVGLFGAYYAGVRNLSTVVMDSLEEPGGQITAMYPEKMIFDVAGFPAVKGRELVDRLVEQAAVHEPTYLLGQQAVGVVRDEDGFTVTTDVGNVIRTRAIVITGGIGTFTPRPLPVGEQYLGRGVAHFVPDPALCAGADVVVVGGGDSAVDWALMLEPVAASVTLVHRRAQFRAHPHSVTQLAASNVAMLAPAQITAIEGDPDVTAVQIDVDGEPRTLPCTRVVAALGFTANLGPLLEWGVEIVGRRHIAANSSGETSVSGIYAAGDIIEYPGKVRLIATGFGEVATAVNNAAAYLDPSVKAFPGHLSDYGSAGGVAAPPPTDIASA